MQVAVFPLDVEAVMVAFPAETAVTAAVVDEVPSTFATFSFEDVHVTLLSAASAGRTVAVRLRVSSAVSSALVLSRLTDSASITLSFTVTVQVAVFPLDVEAVMVAFPAETAVTAAVVDEVPSTFATFSFEDVHVTLLSAASAGRTVAVRLRVSSAVSSALVCVSVTDAGSTERPPPTFTV